MTNKSGDGNSPFNVDLTEMFARMKSPFVPDMRALMDAQRRNVEALTEANRVALEGAQAVARRNLEIMQRTMAELSAGMGAMVGPDGPRERAAKQAELVRSAYQRAVTDMRELGEMIQHSNTEAMEVLNRRFAEAVREVRALTGKE